jgi:gluconate/galactonate dehydratase
MPKITRIRSAVVQANFHWTYVRVYTDATGGGGYGTGECFFAPGLPQIVAEFESILVGEDPRNIERLVEKMRWAASGAGSLGGIIWNAITGIEAALWDLKGKLTNLPVYQLLGGKFRDAARIYLDCHAAGSLECLSTLLQPAPPSWECKAEAEVPPDEIPAASARRARQMVDLGYTALKFDLDLPGSTFDSASGYTLKRRDIDWMVRLASEIRAAVGPDVDLAMDAHWRYRPNEILQVARELEPLRLMWLEDPCPPHDVKSLAYLRSHTTTPIATGENLQLREGFRTLIFDDLVDVVTPDLQKAGGLAEGRKIADMAHTANKPFAPHMIGSPLALLASAHLSLTIPNFTVCEFHAHDVPFFADLCATPIAEWFRHGWVTPPDRPGFGIELNETVGQKHKLPGSQWFDDR